MTKLISGVVMAAVAIVIVGAVLVPATSPTKEGGGWMYDDYRPASEFDNPTVSGAFEIVNISGTDYIHAKDTGEGTIGGERYNVSKADLDLILIWGQSNASYRNAVVSEATYPGLNSGYYFGKADQLGSGAGEGEIDPATCNFYSLVDESGDLRIGDMGPALAKAYHDHTGHKAYLVNAAIGNKWIYAFLPDQQMWTYCSATMSAAVNAVDVTKFNIHIIGYVWAQGEADAGRTVEVYKTWFMMVYNSMSSGLLDGFVFPDVYIIETRPANGGDATTAQNELASEYRGVHMASRLPETFTVANGLMGSDDLHYSQMGKNLIGEEVGGYIADTVSPPSLESSPMITKLIGMIPLIVTAGIVLAIVGGMIIRRYSVID